MALGRDEIRHLITLGEARLAIGDDEGSADAYETVISLDPENPEAHLELGILNEREGRMERAEEHFVESLKADPANPRALYSTRASTTPPTTWRSRKRYWSGP